MASQFPFDHRVFIDDRYTSNADASTSNSDRYQFSFTEDWQPSTFDYATSMMSTWTSFTSLNSTSDVAATLRFTGTGIKLWGNAACMDDHTLPVYFSPTFDDTDPSRHELPGAHDNMYILDIENLEDSEHTLALRGFSPCSSQLIVQLDYALASLVAQTPIEPRDMLLVQPQDPFISYQGSWGAGTIESEVGMTAMETTDRQATMLFTFYGSSVIVFGNNQLQTGSILATLNDEEIEELGVQHLGAFSFYERSGLQPLPDGAPHVLNISLPRASRSVDSFQVEGILYTPTFTTLDELNTRIRAWNSSFFGDEPEPTPNPSPDPTSSPTDTPPPSNDKPNLVGPIIGAVLGVLALAAAILLLVWLRQRRRARKQALLPVASDMLHVSPHDAHLRPNDSSLLSSTTDLNHTHPTPFSRPRFGNLSNGSSSGSFPDLPAMATADTKRPVTLGWDPALGASRVTGWDSSTPSGSSSGGSDIRAPASSSSRNVSLPPAQSEATEVTSHGNRQGGAATVTNGHGAGDDPERLRSMIETLTARVHALEPPPPYAHGDRD